MSDDMLYRSTDGISTTPSLRRIDIRVMRWGEVATDTHEGIRETFARGAFAGVDPTKVLLDFGMDHVNTRIAGAAEAIEEREDGAYARFRVAETPAGDELLALASVGPNGEPPILSDASVVFRPLKSRLLQGGIYERQAVDLARVSVIPRGAYPSAQVLAVREEAHQEAVMNDEAQTVDLSPVTNAIEAVEGRLAALETLQSMPTGQATPEIFRFRSLGEFTAAAYAGPSAYRHVGEGDMLARAIADQITTNNAGVVPPAWLQDVKRVVNLGRRAINAFGGPQALPESGMEVDWPYLNSANTLIAAQSTQKSEIQSQRVDIGKGSASVVTYAGGSDISYQLLQRSSPSYREAYDRIMLAAWASVTDAAFVAALEGATGTTTQVAGGMLGANKTLSTSAAADDIIDCTGHGFSIGDPVVFTALTGGTGLTAGRVYWVVSASYAANTFRIAETPGGTAVDFSADITAGTVAPLTDTGAKFRANLFQASVAIEDATGAPCGVVLASTDVFLALAGMTGIVPPTPVGNPSNASGTALASTLRLDASGLEIIRCPGVSAGKVVLSNGSAAAWLEDGPKWATAEDPTLLGTDVAVYSFAAPAIYAPAGIVEMTLV